MAAGLGFKTFTTGEVLTAADTNGYLMQGVLVFADAAARTAAITSPQEGQVSYLKDTNSTEYYSGSAWVAVGAAGGGITLISETTASALSSLSFSSIPSTYKSLLLVWQGIQQSDTSTGFSIRLNNDSGTNYSNNRNYYNGAGAFGCDNNNITALGDTGNMSPFGRSVNANDTDVSNQNKGFLRIDNYSSTSKYKFYSGQWGGYLNGGGATFMSVNGTYKSNTAISSIDILRWTGTGTFTNSANTSIRLYGIS